MTQRTYQDPPQIGVPRPAEMPEQPPAMAVIDLGNPAQVLELLRHKLDLFEEDRQRLRRGLADENMAPMKSASATRDLLLTVLGNLEGTILATACITTLMKDLPGILQNIVVETMIRTGVLKAKEQEHPANAVQRGFDEAKNGKRQESGLILPVHYRRRMNGF